MITELKSSIDGFNVRLSQAAEAIHELKQIIWKYIVRETATKIEYTK